MGLVTSNSLTTRIVTLQVLYAYSTSCNFQQFGAVWGTVFSIHRMEEFFFNIGRGDLSSDQFTFSWLGYIGNEILPSYIVGRVFFFFEGGGVFF